MSLINDLLRDLEARGASVPVAGALASPPEQAPRPGARGGRLLMALGGVLVLVVGLAFALARPEAVGSLDLSAQSQAHVQADASESAALAGHASSAHAPAGLEPVTPDPAVPASVASDPTDPAAQIDQAGPEPTPTAAPTPTLRQASAQTASPADDADAHRALRSDRASEAAALTPARPAATATAQPRLPSPTGHARSQAVERGTPAHEAGPDMPMTTTTIEAAPVAQTLRIAPVAANPALRLERQLQAASAALHSGREADAEALLLEVLAEQPSALRARQALVALYQRQGRADAAIASLRQGLELDPAAVLLADSLARLLLARGEPAAAAQTLARAVPTLPAAADQHALLAYAHAQAGQAAEAAERYQALVAHDPRRGAWWMGLGLAEAELGRPQAALTALHRARASLDLASGVQDFLDQRIHSLQSAAP
jgi:tetratricopeptide (TPR) repeat protein